MMRAVMFGLLLAAAAPVWAQAAPASMPAAMALVEALNPRAVEQAGLDRQMAALRRGDNFRAMFGNDPRFRAEAAKNAPRFNQGLARAGAIMADAMGPIQRDLLAEQRRLLAQGYAARMSPAELNAALAFFRSPAGVKLVATQGPVMADVSRQVQARFAPRIRAAEAQAAPRVQAELSKLVPQAAVK